MTDRKGDVRPADPPLPELVVHKSTRECPMIQPHPRSLCGIVRIREATRARMDEERRRAPPETARARDTTASTDQQIPADPRDE